MSQIDLIDDLYSLPRGPTGETPHEQFLSLVDKTPCCWIWRGCWGSGGYGYLYLNGCFFQAYRLAFQLFVGVVPAGLELDHVCRLPLCVNPTHLEPVTPEENRRRAVVARRRRRLATPPALPGVCPCRAW
jgi:hypothetical protein